MNAIINYTKVAKRKRRAHVGSLLLQPRAEARRPLRAPADRGNGYRAWQLIGRQLLSEMPQTLAANCVVKGPALETATVRQANTFTIEAVDEAGQRQELGGDHFFVNIRGVASASRVRAVVRDEGDGTYTVEYKCVPRCTKQLPSVTFTEVTRSCRYSDTVTAHCVLFTQA